MTVSEAKEILKNLSCSCHCGDGPYNCCNENCKLSQAVKILTQPKATSEIKAWIARDIYGETGSTIVFAETRAKARYLALSKCEVFEDYKWTEIGVTRFQNYDQYYNGHPLVDWEDQEHRVRLVKDFGWYCWSAEYPNIECETCSAKEWCHHWQNKEG